MTMTRPWRRITLHLSQIGLTLGLTFMFEALSVSVRLALSVGTEVTTNRGSAEPCRPRVGYLYR
jgi:hypothetical protein